MLVNIETDWFNGFWQLRYLNVEIYLFLQVHAHINSHQAPKGYAAAMRKAKILWIESMALVKDMLLRISKPLTQMTNLKSCEIQYVAWICWGNCWYFMHDMGRWRLSRMLCSHFCTSPVRGHKLHVDHHFWGVCMGASFPPSYRLDMFRCN